MITKREVYQVKNRVDTAICDLKALTKEPHSGIEAVIEMQLMRALDDLEYLMDKAD